MPSVAQGVDPEPLDFFVAVSVDMSVTSVLAVITAPVMHAFEANRPASGITRMRPVLRQQ